MEGGTVTFNLLVPRWNDSVPIMFPAQDSVLLFLFVTVIRGRIILPSTGLLQRQQDIVCKVLASAQNDSYFGDSLDPEDILNLPQYLENLISLTERCCAAIRYHMCF